MVAKLEEALQEQFQILDAELRELKQRRQQVEAEIDRLVQAIADGRFGSLAEARQYVARNVQFKRFDPRPSALLAEATRRYQTVRLK